MIRAHRMVVFDSQDVVYFVFTMRLRSTDRPRRAMTSSRRQFLSRAASTGAAVVVAGSVEALFAAQPAAGPSGPAVGYGPLIPDPEGILDLPRGFRYTTLSREGSRPPGGVTAARRFDGMGAFPARGHGSRLVRNHECSPTARVTVHAPPERTYDPAGGGGTSTLVIDRHGEEESEHFSLGGHAINCSGGRSPWHTWLTCEETEDKAGTKGHTKDHGFIFEVDPYDDRRNVSPTPLKAM